MREQGQGRGDGYREVLSKIFGRRLLVRDALPLGSAYAARQGRQPNVWQRVNEDSARWYSEKMPFSIFIVKNLAWQRGVKLSRPDLQLTSRAWGINPK